jgi:DNA-directed RNA polymerase subunit beta'
MAIYLPISKEAKEEVLEKFLSTKNLFNPANASLAMIPSQDIILGVYILTNRMIPYLNNKVEYKGQEVTEDIKIFNDCLPQDYPLINEKVDKNKLISILNDINNKYPYNITATVLDKIKTLGFKYSTVYGTTLSLSGLQMDNVKEMKDLIYSTGGLREQLDRISSKEVEDILKDKFKYSYLIDSGARGTWDQARQIVLSRGFVSNFSGKILETPIKNNLITGLDTEEFFTSSYGCRKGLLDVAINTGDSGYLSRKLAFSCSNLQISTDLEDCGTTDYLDVFVDGDKKARTLLYRYWLNPETKQEEEITKESYKNIIGKIIKLRSPIFCKSEKLCKRCYGNLYKILHSTFVGMVAAQSLGEVATQLVLRVFHTSGVAITKQTGGESNDMKQEDIISDLGNASRLLHSRKETNAAELVSDIFKVYNDSKQIHHVHFECVVSQLMWIGFKKWRLLPSREDYLTKLQFSSIQIVPSKESWILGFAFSNPKKNILKGILNKGNYSGVLDKILVGKKL